MSGDCTDEAHHYMGADERLLQAARLGSAEGVAEALKLGAREVDLALRAALNGGHAAAIRAILERSYLAKTIGYTACLLHRPNLTADERTRATRLLLRDAAARALTQGSQSAYRARVVAVLCAGACLPEGPLLLGALVQDGHFSALALSGAGLSPLPSSRAQPRTRAEALRAARKLNAEARRISYSGQSSGSDAVVCHSVRVRIRRRFAGYDRAGEQLHLMCLGLADAPWSPRLHSRYPLRFRSLVRTLLLCCARNASLGSALGNLYACADAVLLVLEHLASLTFWESPELDLGEEGRLRHEPGLPPHKLPSYFSKEVSFSDDSDGEEEIAELGEGMGGICV